MRKTKRYEFIVDGIVLYVTSGSIKERFFCFFTVMHFGFYCEVSLRSTAPTGLGEV